MKHLYLLIIYSLFVKVHLTTELDKESAKTCKWIYRCCDIIGTVCQQMCDTEIVCETNEQQETIKENVYQLIEARTCRKGFRYENKKCHRVLK